MTNQIPFRTESLANGLTIEFVDRSNRYFGDYWHVDIEARCRVPLSLAGLTAAEAERALRELGDAVEYVRRLERMGVPTAELDPVRQGMVDSFLANARPYLESAAFPHRLVASRLTASRQRRRPYLVDR